MTLPAVPVITGGLSIVFHQMLRADFAERSEATPNQKRGIFDVFFWAGAPLLHLETTKPRIMASMAGLR